MLSYFLASRTMEAFLDDYHFLYWYVSNDKSCELRVQSDTLMQGGYGFPMNKDLVHASNINQAIIKLSGSDDISVLYNKWFSNACRDTMNSPKMVQLGINHFGGLFLLLCTTVLVCFPLLVPEHWYDRYLKNRLSQWIKRIFQQNQKKEKSELAIANEQLSVVLDNRERSFSVIQAIKMRAEALAKFD